MCSSFKDYLNEQLQNPQFKEEWDMLEEYASVQEEIENQGN